LWLVVIRFILYSSSFLIKENIIQSLLTGDGSISTQRVFVLATDNF